MNEYKLSPVVFFQLLVYILRTLTNMFLQLYRADRFDYYIDAARLSTSNWLRFIRYEPANDSARHNIQPFECRGRMFYRTVRHVQKGQELVVSDPVMKIVNTTQEMLELRSLFQGQVDKVAAKVSQSYIFIIIFLHARVHLHICKIYRIFGHFEYCSCEFGNLY